VEKFWDSPGVGVGLEAGEEVVDELDAARCSQAPGEEQGLGGGGRGGLGLGLVEVAGGAVGEEHAAGLVPGCGQEAFAFGDELVGAGGVAEVEETLAGVDGEVGLGDPCAPGGSVTTGSAEVLLGCGQGPQCAAAFLLCGEGAREAQLERATRGRVVGAGQGVVEDVCRGGGVTAPGGLVGEVAQQPGAQVVVARGVGVVQAGAAVRMLRPRRTRRCYSTVTRTSTGSQAGAEASRWILPGPVGRRTARARPS
jgi:hypothetical protein